MGESAIDQSKIKIIVSIALFALVWNILIINFLANWDSFKQINPVFQYILYNLGFVALSIATIGVVLSLVRKKHLDLKTAIIDGILSFLLFSLVFDLWQPPFAYDAQGNSLIKDSKSLIGASVDEMLGYVFISLFPNIQKTMIPFINVSFLYVAIYILVPVVWTILIAVALMRGEFIKWAKTGIGVKA